ncbi:MAG: hypothetical protein QG637_572, partial [Chloroflexota bacterium]|nr:hypothetical protein [Chloroflexota bacterium]
MATLSRHPWIAIALVFASTLAAYLSTLVPGVAGGDAGEMQFTAPLFAIAHSTGYPLYVALGFLWAKLVPIGTVALRMNLLAAVSAAAGCAIVAGFVCRLHRSSAVAIAAGLSLGYGLTYWGQAVIADKYAFNAIFVAAITGLALVWIGESRRPQADRLLYVLSLVYGLSLLHHRTMLLFGPCLALLVIWHERGELARRWRRTLTCLALVALPPLIGYGIYLPFAQSRNLSPVEWRPTDISGWIEWLIYRQYSLAAFGLDGLGPRLAYFGATLLADHTIVVPLLALGGLAAMARRQGKAALFLLASFAITGILSANYRAYERPYYFFLPAFILLIYAYAAGLAWAQRFAGRWLLAHPGLTAPGRLLCAVLALAIPALQFAHAYPVQRLAAVYGAPLDIWRQSLKSGTLGERLAANMGDLPQDAVLVGDWEQLTVFWYYQKVEGVRPDLLLVYPIERVGEYLGGPRPVCLMRHLPVSAAWRLTNVGAVACLNAAPVFAAPQGITPIGTALTTPAGQPRLELLGHSPLRAVYSAGQYAPVTLSWRALSDISENWAISL